MKKSGGFTLVELAIVMVIIGLLIGGILKGQSLIEAARIKSIITQTKSYFAATNAYKDKYGSMPGDDVMATLRVPGCTIASFCLNGNGDGRIGTPAANYSHDNQSGLSGPPGVETTMYWKHLLLADLITGVEGNANPSAPAWGRTHPACRGCGGFQVLYSTEVSVEGTAVGNFLILRPSVSGDPHPNAAGEGAVSPAVASEIDHIMDDGNAKTGYVQSDSAGNLCASQANGSYDTTKPRITV